MSFLGLHNQTLRTLDAAGVQITTGLVYVEHHEPQIMSVGLPQTATSGQCPGSNAVPLTSLISAFMSPPPCLKLPPKPHDCSEPSPPCNAACAACLAARDRCNKQLHKPKWIILLKTPRWKNIPHLIAVSTTTSGCLRAVSLRNDQDGAGKSTVCSSSKTFREPNRWFGF